MDNEKFQWEPRCDRFVAFMDIMGFKERVFRDSHENVSKVMEEIRKQTRKIKKEAKNKLEGRPRGWDTFGKTAIIPVIFSDSIILFSSDKSKSAFEYLVFQTKRVMYHALKNNIPIKGAIAYGEQTAAFKKSLYFGKPLIDAFELQKELFFYGVILHHTVQEYLVTNEWIERPDELGMR